MSFLFEELKVYQKSMLLTENILELTKETPKGGYALIDQLRRSVLSIPTNLAEGCGRFHVNDRCQFFWIARGSANECVPLLRLATIQRIITEPDEKRLRGLIEEVCRMTSALITAAKEKATKPPQQSASTLPHSARPAPSR